jgi:hypothetical protein
MSSLILDKLITKCGGITNSTLGGYVDAAGNIVGSAQFLANFIVDYAGNLGTLDVVVYDCTFIASIIGSAFPPGDWEMQASTVETVGLNDGIISNNFIAGTANPNLLHTFVSKNATGYLTGVVSGNGTWTIKAGPESIAGTGYVGAGLLVASGANTHFGNLIMEVGTKLQLGLDCSNAATRVLGNLTINEGAVATQYTAYTINTYLTQALNNNGTYNVTGCGDCGKGGLGLATTVANNGIINLDKTQWRNQSTWSGTGTVNVKDGATFQLTVNPIGATTRFNINGCGWKNASCVEQGAIHVSGTGLTFAMKINVQTAACIKNAVNVNNTFSGLLTGSAPLTISSLSATKPNGILHFSNTANTYNGTITVDGTTINASYGNSLQYAKIVLVNGGRIGTNSNTSQVIGSLASNDPTTYWQSGDPSNNTIKNNGITTFAGRLLWIGGSYAANYFLDGGSQNQLTMTGTGNTGNIYPRNGAKLILQGATFTAPGGQVRVQTGATVSAGTSTTASCTYLYIDATSKLEVKAVGAGASLMNVTTGFVPSAGWKVDLPDAMAAGTYDIVSYLGTATTILPTIGVNNSGRSVSFAYANGTNPKKLRMTLV